MSKLLIKDKTIVLPGDVVAEGMDYLPTPGILREKEKLISSQIGLIHIDGRLIKLIPLTGSYMPKKEDNVIGNVVNIGFNGWTIDIGHSNLAMLSLRDGSNDFIDKKADLSQYYDFNDVVVTKILNVNKSNLIDLTMKDSGLMKLHGGRFIDVTPSKIPRIIGKQGSMISMIKEKTKCNMIVGQNGKIWIKGDAPEDERKAISAIELIENGAQMEGLTDKIEKFLGGNK